MGRWNGSTTERGYGAKHAAIRKQRIASHRPGDPCAMGGEPLWQPVEQLDVPHDHVNGGYLPGLACRAHNRAEGAIRNNAIRGFTLASYGPKGPYVICKDCGQNYTRAARACMVCGAHYHPSYADQRTCGRKCGVELRRQIYGHAAGAGRPRQPRSPCAVCGQPCATPSETTCKPCRAAARQAERDAKPGPSSKVAYYTCRYCGTLGVAKTMGHEREVCPARQCQLARIAANNLRVRDGLTPEAADAQVAHVVTGAVSPSQYNRWARARDW